MRFRARARKVGPPGSMNKLEQEYLGRLMLQKSMGVLFHYGFEPIKFRLADRTYYTPDFMVIRSDGEIQFHEVKGFWEEDARVKIKVVAEMFPFFGFVGVRKQHGDWAYETFGPEAG